MAEDAKILEKGDHWKIVYFKNNENKYLHLLCVRCGHLISFSFRRGWLHSNPAAVGAERRSCYVCSCESPTPPSLEERNRAYAELKRLRSEWKWKPQDEIDI